MMALVGAFAYEFQVTLPVMAKQGLHVGAAGYGFMTAAMGLGAVVGGLFVATKGSTGLPPLVLAASAFGVRARLRERGADPGRRSCSRSALVGGASISFMATGNSTLQLSAARTCAGA